MVGHIGLRISCADFLLAELSNRLSGVHEVTGELSPNTPIASQPDTRSDTDMNSDTDTSSGTDTSSDTDTSSASDLGTGSDADSGSSAPTESATTSQGVANKTFTPTELDGLVGWFDASDYDSLTLSDNEVTAVNNLAGENGLSSSSDGGPNYVASCSVANGLSAFEWPNNDSLVGLEFSEELTVQDIFIVLAYGAGVETEFLNYNTIITDENALDGSSSNRIIGSRRSSSLLSSALSSDVSFHINGEESTTSILPLPLSVLQISVSSGFLAYNLGGKNFSAARAWRGLMCEILLFDQRLSETDVRAVKEYLSTKWSIN